MSPLLELQDARFCVIDVETTGLVAARDRITEIAAVRIENLRIDSNVFTSLINPERPVPGLITELTGISDEMLRGAPFFADVAEELMAYIEGCYIVAHNASFDMGFLHAEFLRSGLPFSPPASLDTVTLARRVLPGLAQYKLASLCHHLHIKPGMHRAVGDALATAELFIRLAHLAPGVLSRRLSKLPKASG